MTEQQDVLDPRRPRRRRTPIILLGALPVAIAATLLVAGPHYVDPVSASTDASGTGKVAAARTLVTPGVVAPASAVNVAAVPQITVTVPKVEAPAAKVAKVPAKSTATKTTVKKTTVKKTTVKKTTAKKTVKKSTKTYKQYCANPNPVSASGSTGKALLTAVNKERAKLGIKPLKWSSSMASVATSWSKTMVKNDAKTASTLLDGLAHNPNRPGAENVAAVYSSGGYSAATAVKKMHANLVRSNGHCLNLMNPAYSSMGAGVAHSSDNTTWYATENFR